MNDNELWHRIWKCFSWVLVVLFLCITVNCQGTKLAVAKMVEAGASPMDAGCALGVDGLTQVECVSNEILKNQE